jgi:hypothetical protein
MEGSCSPGRLKLRRAPGWCRLSEHALRQAFSRNLHGDSPCVEDHHRDVHLTIVTRRVALDPHDVDPGSGVDARHLALRLQQIGCGHLRIVVHAHGHHPPEVLASR